MVNDCYEDMSNLDNNENNIKRLKNRETLGKIFETFNKVYEVIYIICDDNSSAKAQIFSGIGGYHLLGLINRFDISTAIFILNLASHMNIGAYITRDVFKKFSNAYADVFHKVCKI